MTNIILWVGAMAWASIVLAQAYYTGHVSDHAGVMSSIYLCAALIHGGRK